MELFEGIIDALALLPYWVVFLPPALLILAAVPLVLFERRKLYTWCAALLGSVGFVLCIGNLQAAFCFLAMYVALALLLLPLFRLRGMKLKKRESREARIYRKFHKELEGPVLPERRSGNPPKVCCFEPEPVLPEESGMELGHVIKLLEKLRREKLSSADRLEVDILSRTVDGCKGRALTPSQLDSLNDCLASVLRLTAKYKL